MVFRLRHGIAALLAACIGTLSNASANGTMPAVPSSTTPSEGLDSPFGVAMGPVPAAGGFVPIMVWGITGKWRKPWFLRVERAEKNKPFKPWGALPFDNHPGRSASEAIGPEAPLPAAITGISLEPDTALLFSVYIPKLDRNYRYRTSTCDEFRFSPTANRSVVYSSVIASPAQFSSLGDWISAFSAGGQLKALDKANKWKPANQAKGFAAGTVLRAQRSELRFDTFAVVPKSVTGCKRLTGR